GAGGGVPQWNCNCRVCHEARAGAGRVRPRTQSCVAVTADDRRWFLLNASPDIRSQIEGFPPLHPPAGMNRGSPVEGVLLTNADLDHTLGLFLLREGDRLRVHATAAVRRSLTEGLSLARTLEAFCGVEWIQPPSNAGPLPCRDGSKSGLLYQAFAVAGSPPRFMRDPPGASDVGTVGYLLRDEGTGGRLLFLPDVGKIDDALARLLPECDVLLFDGTFWSEHEMRERGAGHHPASHMGHLPISGADGSLKVLAETKVKNRIYIHINNTNPILLEDSPERAAVTKAGCAIGWDGMEISI
ncbi:MAG: pyrroloquinoline quinone biosynthesis protein PqqB, partial [Verrucomicrobiota bacterium]